MAIHQAVKRVRDLARDTGSRASQRLRENTAAARERGPQAAREITDHLRRAREIAADHALRFAATTRSVVATRAEDWRNRIAVAWHGEIAHPRWEIPVEEITSEIKRSDDFWAGKKNDHYKKTTDQPKPPGFASRFYHIVGQRGTFYLVNYQSKTDFVELRPDHSEEERIYFRRTQLRRASDVSRIYFSVLFARHENKSL